ncbi:hypothetical protein DAEQUDRAFT_761390 [Daedalea quercina L-15889]|uniref:Uncharacterized protein n=1 Tax=Daedalea quercina L-15889 TaxID=1314783 RepID=A0A165U8J3_9APHY|nr:hypothetical protein DAEQUDRAFT_761390 [Daedalea quercina L-15889]
MYTQSSSTQHARHVPAPRVRTTNISFRQQLIHDVNTAYGAQFQRLWDAWVNYQRATLEADKASLDAYAAGDVDFDPATGFPLDDLAIISPPDDCPLLDTATYPDSLSPEPDLEEDINLLRSQASMRQKIQNEYKESMDKLVHDWEHHLKAIKNSRYLNPIARPPAPSAVDLVSRLHYYAAWDTR